MPRRSPDPGTSLASDDLGNAPARREWLRLSRVGRRLTDCRDLRLADDTAATARRTLDAVLRFTGGLGKYPNDDVKVWTRPPRNSRNDWLADLETGCHRALCSADGSSHVGIQLTTTASREPTLRIFDLGTISSL